MTKQKFNYADLSLEGAALLNDLVEILSSYDGYQGVLPPEQLTLYRNRAYHTIKTLVSYGYDFRYYPEEDKRLET